MIDYQTFHELRRLRDQEHLSVAQIAAALNLDERTVGKWIAVEKYQPCKTGERKSKLDPFKGTIVRLLDQHPYTAAQLLHRLKEAGYDGGYSILKAFVQHVRPAPAPAFLTLHFAPGQSAQVDWGDAGFLPVGHTRRRLSFFVMVLGYSRRMYVEFTLAQSLEHFLACHQHAFEYLGGVPLQVMVDNAKVAVLRHPRGQPALFQPHYLDFARHYGFEIKACAVRSPHQKGFYQAASPQYPREQILHFRISILSSCPWLFRSFVLSCRDPSLSRSLQLRLWQQNSHFRLRFQGPVHDLPFLYLQNL